MHPDAVQTIADLELAPHPEGGYYREIFRSSHSVRATDGRIRPALTVIYFLLERERCSAWHRLRSDETWHFARGKALLLDLIDSKGRHESLFLKPEGPWQATIPAGTSFAARALESFTLVTCCVAPGFDFEDFELLDARELALRFPDHAETIGCYAPGLERNDGAKA